MVQRGQRVRLAAAERRAELQDPVTAAAGQPIQHIAQQPPHAAGEIGGGKEVARLPIDARDARIAGHQRAQVNRIRGDRGVAGFDVVVQADDLAPGAELVNGHGVLPRDSADMVLVSRFSLCLGSKIPVDFAATTSNHDRLWPLSGDPQNGAAAAASE